VSVGAWAVFVGTGGFITALAGNALGGPLAWVLAFGYVCGAAVLWGTGGARG
jgi:hypothetical protein